MLIVKFSPGQEGHLQMLDETESEESCNTYIKEKYQRGLLFDIRHSWELKKDILLRYVPRFGYLACLTKEELKKMKDAHKN